MFGTLLPRYSASVGSDSRKTEGQIDALDNCRIASDPLAIGNGQFLHARRVHSHFARACHHHRPDPCDSGQKSGGLTTQRSQVVTLLIGGKPWIKTVWRER